MKRILALMLGLIILMLSASCSESQEVSPSPAVPETEEAFAEPTGTPAATATAEPTEPPLTSQPVLPLHLKVGDTSEVVAGIQKRLMDLNYLDSDEPTDYYSSGTAEAVKRFQRRNSLEVTGCIEDGDYSILMSSRARTYIPGPGDEGEDISILQERLHELGYLDGITGVFDDETENAVLLFQEKNLLDTSGMLTEETVECLYYDSVVPNSPDLGTSGEQILEYQQKLYELGYLITEPTGTYGEDTVSAVARFQARNGLFADGYLGPSTVEALMSDEASFNTLEYAMSGDDVLRLQTRLAELNYLKQEEINGYFGAVTETAVRYFQINNGIEEDGMVNRQTRDVLYSSSAIAADASHPAMPGPGQTLRPTAVPTNTPRPSNPILPGGLNQSRVNKLISIAAEKINCPYVSAAKGPNSFDCSGFVYWCLNKAGVHVSYMTSYKWRTTNLFPRISSFSDVQAGDIMVFRMDEYKGHVAIAIGNGMMIDASSTTGRVVCRSCNTAYWKRVFYCAYRIYGN